MSTRNTLTFDIRNIEDYIKTELPIYIKTVSGLENVDIYYQDNITRIEPIFPCFSFEIYSLGAVESKIDSNQIETATTILLDLDTFVDNDNTPLSSRDLSNDISFGIATFVNEKLGLKIIQNDRVPNAIEGVFRKKIRATGIIDNEDNIIYTN